MRALIRVLRPAKSLLILTLIASMLTGVFSTLIIKEIQQSLVGEQVFNLAVFSWYFFSLIVAYLIAALLSSVSIAKINRDIIHNLRLTLSERILEAPFERVEGLRSNILPILTDDLNHIANLINRLPSVVTGLATVLGILVYLFWLSPLMASLTLLGFACVFVVNKINLSFIGRYSRENREQSNVIYKLIEGLVYGMANLVMHQKFRERYVDITLRKESNIQMDYYFKETALNSFNNRLNDVILLSFLGGMIILVYLYSIVSISFFATYLTLILFMLGPLSTVSGFLGTIKRIEASVIQIEHLGIELEAESDGARVPAIRKERNQELADGTPNISTLSTPNKQPLIGVSDLRFHYANDEYGFGLEGINLELNAGEIIYIEGGNGSGKSTLIKLICGLYRQHSGTVWHQGKVVDETNLDEYRNQFAVILTDSYVFKDLKHLTDEQLEKGDMFLSMLQMDKKVQIQNGVFSTTDLSQGQKKRLELVHMLLEDKAVYIFDEWVAYQDITSKNIFYTRVLPYLKDQAKLVINVAHDYSYGDVADKVLRMEDGNII
jgi:putative pyoverdin transport system ATP-binding/permease protein